MRLPFFAALFAAVTLPLASCGGGDSAQTPKELYAAAAKAFNDKDYADAVKSLTGAIDGMGDDMGDLRKKAQIMLAKASAHVSPDQASTAFADFAGENPDMFTASDFADVANSLMDAEGGIVSAAKLVRAAENVFPAEAATFAPINALIAEKKAAGELSADDEAILGSLGYL